VQIWTGPRSDHFTMLPKMFWGEHLPHPHVVEYRIKSVSVETDRPVAIQADGDPVGFTPATFKVIPQAVNVKL